jgi:hypothetical protein
MDISNEYLKMVLSLPEEFFEDWEWKTGDRAILLDDSYKREVMILNTDTEISRHKLKVAKLLFPGSLNGVKTEERFERLRPISSQEQLQEMCINFHMKHNGMTRKRAILHVMGFWADTLTRKHDFEYKKVEDNLDYEYFGDPEDFSILMLKYTVSLIYMLTWDGEQWV